MPQSKENKLNFSAEFEKFFSLSFDLLCIAGVDGYFKKLNPAFEKVLGYTQKELLAKPFLEFVHSDDLQATLNEVEKLSKGIPTIHFRNRYYCKDGSLKILDWTCAPDPETGIIYAAAKDITEEIKKNEEINKLSLVAQSTENGILIANTDGIVEWVNEGFSRITGYGSDEILGRTPSSVMLGPNTSMETINYAIKKQAAREPFYIEVLISHKSGKTIWISVVNTPVKENNELKGKHIEIISDITDKKKTEFQLIRAKDIAEQSAKVKEQFLANMSHEIRTPMNSIIGFTELLMQSKLNSDQQDSVNAIRQAGDNLTVIINDILDFSKIEAGKLNIEHSLFSFPEVIKTVKSLFALKAQQKNVKLIFNIDHKIPEVLVGDAVRLDQVLINLVSNAMKFTSKGWIEISAELKSIAEKRCIIQFKIEDTGIGIPKDKLDVVFQSFTQASNDTTRKYGGTGLGLTIVDQLVKLMGGTLNLKSNEGTGTLFSFTLEFEQGSEEDIILINKVIAPAEDVNLNGMKILLCEDNEMNQRLVHKIISKQWNADLDIAPNGKVGFDLFKKNDYSIILMDVQMPEMDGFETTRRIRKYRDKEKAQIPIMAMTADALVEERKKCFEAGMNDYLSKPFKQGELLHKILTLSGNKSNENKREEYASDSFVNTQSLKELTGGDDVFMAEMIEIYLRNTPVMLKEIKASFKKHDFEKLKRTAHKIKSSFGMMGMSESLQIADSIEQSDEKNSDQDLLKAKLDRLTELVAGSEKELKRELDNLKK
jgi:PAS domain S-box-containing protein